MAGSLQGVMLTAEQVAGLKALYEDLAQTHPRSAACKRIPLDFLVGLTRVVACAEL